MNGVLLKWNIEESWDQVTTKKFKDKQNYARTWQLPLKACGNAFKPVNKKILAHAIVVVTNETTKCSIPEAWEVSLL